MLNYLLEVSLCWLAFYLLYTLWLSKETFFHVNRWYLIVTLLLGLVIPFAEIPSATVSTYTEWNYLETVTITVQQAEAQVATVIATPLSEGWSLQHILQVIYVMGLVLVTLRFGLGLWQIYDCYSRSRKEKKEGYILVYNEKIQLPFSFFHYLFINASANYTSSERESIIRHELVHIKERHSVDVLLLEILNILFWCSPLIYGYRRSIRNVHEYLADASVLQKSTKKQYGQLLLQQFQKGPGIAMANNFIHSQLKKRIQMMTRNQSANTARWKYLTVIPVFLLLFFVLSKSELMAQLKPADDATEIENSPNRVHPVMKSLNGDPIYEVVDEMPRFPGCEEVTDQTERIQCAQRKMLDFIFENIKYPTVAKKENVEGVVVIRFVIDKEGNITNPEIVKEIGAGCGEEALRVVKAMPLWVPGKHKGKKVDVYFNLPVKYKLDGEAAKSKEGKNNNSMKLKDNPKAATFPEGVYVTTEEMPRFPGCEDLTDGSERNKCAQEKLLDFVYSNVKYPKTANAAGAEGTVVVRFVIDETGNVTNPEIVRSAGQDLDESVLAMMDEMVAQKGKWIPGKQSGKNVSVMYNLPVRFKLDAAAKSDKVENNTLDVPSFSINPNPTTDQVTITFDMADTKGLSLSISDAAGHQVASLPNNTFTNGFNRHTLDLKNAPTGVLFITLEKENKVFTKQLVKQ